MTSDRAIRGFLAEPDNLRAALGVVRELEPLKVRLHEMFWSEFMELMAEYINDPARDYSSYWRVPVISKSEAVKGNTYFDIRPKSRELTGGDRVMFVRLHQRDQADDFRFRYGVVVDGPKPSDEEEKLASVKSAKKILRDGGFKYDGRSWWWLGLKQLEPGAREDRFLLAMAGDRKAFVREFADNVWRLFTNIEETLREVNNDLNANSQRF